MWSELIYAPESQGTRWNALHCREAPQQGQWFGYPGAGPIRGCHRANAPASLLTQQPKRTTNSNPRAWAGDRIPGPLGSPIHQPAMHWPSVKHYEINSCSRIFHGVQWHIWRLKSAIRGICWQLTRKFQRANHPPRICAGLRQVLDTELTFPILVLKDCLTGMRPTWVAPESSRTTPELPRGHRHGNEV